MKIIFAGTPDFAVPSLKTLIKHFDVCAVITQPDRPCGRGQKIKQSPVKEAVLEYNQQDKIKNIPIFTQPINQLFNQLTKLQPDLIVVAAYGQILSQKILDIPRIGAINIHASLLPKYRGPSPIQAAILNGGEHTGISIIKMTSKLDAGPIIAKAKIKITADETAGSLHDKLARLGAELLEKTLSYHPERLPADKAGSERSRQKFFSAKLANQNDAKATYVKKITKSDAQLDLSKPAQILERQIRAYNPWPGAWIQILNSKFKIQNSNIKKLKILRAKIKHKNSQTALPTIPCGDGNLLILTEVQPEGKKRMSGEEFARGYLENRLHKINNKI